MVLVPLLLGVTLHGTNHQHTSEEASLYRNHRNAVSQAEPFRNDPREAFGVREQGLFAPALVRCALCQAWAKATAAYGRSRTPNASRGSNAAGIGQWWSQKQVA